MTPANRDLDVDEVLDRCQWGVPVNVRMDVAINAHCLASLSGNRQVTAYALRTVILARTPEVSDLQSQITALQSEIRESEQKITGRSGDYTAESAARKQQIAADIEKIKQYIHQR